MSVFIVRLLYGMSVFIVRFKKLNKPYIF